MSEVTQTILLDDSAGRQGNCLQAAVASLLDLPLDEVPHFIEFDDWFGELVAFAAALGFEVTYQAPPATPPALGLALGQSARGVTHVVVYRDRQAVWDPHPNRSGLVTVEAFLHFEGV